MTVFTNRPTSSTTTNNSNNKINLLIAAAFGIGTYMIMQLSTTPPPPDCSTITTGTSTVSMMSSSSSLSPSSSSSYHYQYYDQTEYVSTAFELYVYQNAEKLGLTHTDFNPSGCYLWNYDATIQARSGASLPTESERAILQHVPNDVRHQYFDHVQHMQQYQKYITQEFTLQLPPYVVVDPVTAVATTTTSTTTTTTTSHKYIDIRQALRYYNHTMVCDALQVPWADTILQRHTSTPLLSYIEHSTSTTGTKTMGERQFVEPLLPQLRNALMCENKNHYLLDMNYMIHDFRYICNKMTPHTRTIFVDMGGSLLFHGGANPAIQLVDIYQKFGIIFDHIYAYEMTPFTPEQTKSIFESLIPDMWQTSYHWINTGVDSTVDSNLNPFTMIKNHFTPEDFIIVKLDIDTPFVEHPLAQQLLNDPILHTLIDQFYFEYHVKLKELQEQWGSATEGSIYDALHLMTQLRQKGIASHFWV